MRDGRIQILVMSGTTIQIRNVSEELQQRLRVRAAVEGMSISDYVLREIRKSLERPTRQETLSRLKAQPVRNLRRRPASVVRDRRGA